MGIIAEWVTTMMEGAKYMNTEMPTLEVPKGVSKVTKHTIEMFNALSPEEFFRKYQCTKKTYYRRVKMYIDPGKHSPLAKLGRALGSR